MNQKLNVHVIAIVSLLVLGLAATAMAQPPFRSGEVVVAGSPDRLGDDVRVIKYLPNADLTVIAVDPGRELGQVQRFAERGRRAGLNYIAQAFSVNDPFFSPYQWHLSHIQAESAWNVTTGNGAVVAVVDTGLKAGGADGIGCVRPGYDAVNNDNDPSDGDGHGTHVSGTVAQTSNNNTGCAGMAYGACVMPVKVLGDDGSGSFADIADGIYWAVDHGADVINMSLGINARYGVTNDPVVDPALDYAYANGVTVVVASGNDSNRRNVSYPAIYPTCIAVGATGYDNGVVRYSNKGTGLDVVAPGGDTSVDKNGDGYVDGVLQETYTGGAWGYYFFQGTSMAAPHVAAVAALLYANDPTMTPDRVYAALTNTALDIEGAGFDNDSGYGLVQAYDALVYGGGTTCTDNDNDGWCAEEGDCDDANPFANPGEAEICDDLTDNNCDGSVDEGCDGGSCFPQGADCSTGSDCCSGSCHFKKLTCR